MEEEFKAEDVSRYRSLVVRCNYLAPGRPDIAFSVKELARQMSNPTVGDGHRLKRFGRYLKGQPRVQQLFQWQRAQRTMKTFSDVDWAGCKSSRKSTTGGCVMVGSHVLKGWG